MPAFCALLKRVFSSFYAVPHPFRVLRWVARVLFCRSEESVARALFTTMTAARFPLELRGGPFQVRRFTSVARFWPAARLLPDAAARGRWR
jgi:hypothetical protein